jgi:hypothetical protein
MRLASCLCFLFCVAVVSSAQSVSSAQDADTNFPAGPQYLMNYGFPLLFQSLETPELSLLRPRAVAPSAPAEEHSGVPDTRSFGELQNQTQIDRVYWGVNPNGTPAQIPAENVQSPNENENQNEVESSSALPSPSLPPGFFDVGVTGIANAKFLREHGYTPSLAKIAAFWKTHRRNATHVYTNADIARLHGQPTTSR